MRPRNADVLGRFYYFAGRDSEALDLWNRIEELAPARTYKARAEFYMSKGDYEKVVEDLSKAEKLQPANPTLIMIKGILAGLRKDKDGASKAMELLSSSGRSDRSSQIGFIHHAMGDLDSFFECMERALDEHTIQATELVCNPLFAKARGEKRYESLAQKMNQMYLHREVPPL